MLPQVCLLAFVVSNAAAAEPMTLKELCDGMIMNKTCGDVDARDFKGENNIYFLNSGGCTKTNINVTADNKTLCYEIGNYTFQYDVQEDDCLKPTSTDTEEEEPVEADPSGETSTNETETLPPTEEELLEINMKLEGTCDEVFFNVECYASEQVAFLVSKDADAECIKKALDKVGTDYGITNTTGLEEDTCQPLSS